MTPEHKAKLAAGRKNMPRKAISHTVRTGSGRMHTFSRYSYKKAVTTMCIECMGFESDPRTDCTSPNCPLYPFRAYSRATVK